ncbi:MAG TPA: potassium-transporting ATPase subunit KdpB, partial [Thermodesulfobacteriota bacterium]|nr:potassium-transporting ATPase subunit KdpB [Thermodesulfobacteriota bacterium]
MAAKVKARSLFDKTILIPAIWDAVRKLHPRVMVRNPVMFVALVGAAVTTVKLVITPIQGGSFGFFLQITIWLWFTVLFANFAEAMAEGRGKAQAATLRRARTQTMANRRRSDGSMELVPAESLRKGDIFVVKAGELIPADGEVIEGAATVNESAITGESAPVIREAGGDRSAVTGGTSVLSDEIVVRVTANPGESFMDRMIGLIEGASRQKTPNEIALTILLAALTIIFLVVIVTLKPFGAYSEVMFSVPVLVALLVCLIPTTIGGLLSAIGIAGIDRLVQKNVLAMSGRAAEAAGDVDVLLLDKTGTITLGNRQAVEFLPAPGVTMEELASVAQLASLADETPEGRSIVVLAKDYGLRGRELHEFPQAQFVPFTAKTRMSGLNLDGEQYRKGAADAVREFVGSTLPREVEAEIQRVGFLGGTPLVVASSEKVLGTIYLKDIVKGGLPDRFERFRAMGIKTIMITGDNPLTAAAIAKEAGVDDFLAEAKPEDKLALIRRQQAAGHLVAMTGDGTNDAPALAQADVGVAMNTGTQAAKEAGNMVDLDSNPTKLIEVVEIGKQLLMTRGALTTFSVANDVAKYFAIIPAMLMVTFPQIAPLNIMHLASPESAIL